jgi:hypothetical protein
MPTVITSWCISCAVCVKLLGNLPIQMVCVSNCEDKSSYTSPNPQLPTHVGNRQWEGNCILLKIGSIKRHLKTKTYTKVIERVR